MILQLIGLPMRKDYLEFIVETNSSQDPQLNTRLAILYMEMVLAYRKTSKNVTSAQCGH